MGPFCVCCEGGEKAQQRERGAVEYGRVSVLSACFLKERKAEEGAEVMKREFLS